jgi:hypothetical protein
LRHWNNAGEKPQRLFIPNSGADVQENHPVAALLILFKKPSDIDLFTVVLINEEMGY